MTENKNHWYDGWFYDRFIAPNQHRLFRQIKNLIPAQSAIIDVGCGTGRLAFLLSGRNKSILGIDLSKRNIDRAQLLLFRRPNDKISFQHSTISDIRMQGLAHFDFAVLTYVIHEVAEAERIDLLNEIGQIADRIIIGDYLAPQPKSFSNHLTRIIEFLAGADHYKNYKSYMANGGIYHLADKAGLKIIKEIANQPSTNHIVVLGR